MPFPSEPLTFRGGCNCHAVRYRVTLPVLGSRADSPYDPDNTSTNPLDLKLPMSLICHCNSCRRSSGQLMSTGMAVELSTIELLLAPRSTPGLSAAESGAFAVLSASERDRADEERFQSSNPVSNAETMTTWIPAGRVFHRAGGVVLDDLQSQGPMDTYLMSYPSSPKRSRLFCSRCGTPLFYFITWEEGRPGFPDPWPTQLDIWTGTVDRADLEADAFKPAVEVWLDLQIGWMGDIVGDEGIRRCRTWK